MDSVKEATANLKEALLNKEEVKEYFKYKEEYENSAELNAMRKELMKHDKKSSEYNSLLEKYNSHPIVVNYMSSKEEVAEILRSIRDIIGNIWYLLFVALLEVVKLRRQ